MNYLVVLEAKKDLRSKSLEKQKKKKKKLKKKEKKKEKKKRSIERIPQLLEIL